MLGKYSANGLAGTAIEMGTDAGIGAGENTGPGATANTGAGAGAGAGAGTALPATANCFCVLETRKPMRKRNA